MWEWLCWLGGKGGPGTRGAWGQAKVNGDSFPLLASQLLPELV